MICPKCGTANDNANAFCINCAQPLNAPLAATYQQPVYQQPVYQQPQAPQQKSRKKLIMIAVVVVIAIVVIAAIAVAAMSGAKTNGDSNGSIFGSVTITPTSSRPYYMVNPYLQPASGDKVVVLTFTVNNGKSATIYTNPFYYQLTGSDGLVYSLSYLGNYSAPTDILGGKSAVVSVSFEIPNSVTPASLAYDDGLGDSCKANFASVWSSNIIMPPDYLHLSAASYAATSSGSVYITPSAGDKFISVTVTITNKDTVTHTLSEFDFTLSTSDGLTHDVTYLISNDLPTGLQAGSSVTVHMPFEISSSSTPTTMEYNDMSSLSTVTF